MSGPIGLVTTEMLHQESWKIIEFFSASLLGLAMFFIKLCYSIWQKVADKASNEDIKDLRHKIDKEIDDLRKEILTVATSQK